jgi:PAS domain S-box-containing protein
MEEELAKEDKHTIKVMVVEDESIVAKDIQNRLKRLGYNVVDVVSSGEEAIRKVAETQPDLVLMDIVLKGDIDGIEAAKQINTLFNIPIVYLTAYADDSTIQRAKITEPFGYILKPFQVKELHSAIQIALYKHEVEKKLKEKKSWFSTTLKSISDAVILTDTKGSITYMNVVAESLTGWKWEEAIGKDLEEVFHIVKQDTRTIVESLVTKAILQGVVISPQNHFILISKDGRETPLDLSAEPIRDDLGKIRGVVFVFREITLHKHEGHELSKDQKFESSMADEFENSRIRMMIATPSSIVRQGVRKMLESEKYVEIIAEISNYQNILLIIERSKPDVLFFDATQSTINIVEILRSIREESPETKVLLLLHELDEEFIMNTLSVGVRGYLIDTSNADQFIQAIRAVSKDEIWGEIKIITKILTRLLPSKRGSPGLQRLSLTKRQEEIVKLIIQGYSNRQISDKLFISEKTVKAHLNNVYKKLGLSSRLQLVADFLG